MKIVFYDTETSGLTAQDRLYHLAYRIVDFGRTYTIVKDVNEKFNIPVKINPQASAINKTYNSDLVGFPFLKDSPLLETIRSDFQLDDTFYVAHNALFDITMLNRENIKISNMIDTVAVAKKYIGYGVPNHKLQTLRTHYLDNNIDADAHDAFGDIIVLEAVFKKLFHEVKNKHTDIKYISDIMNIMKKCSYENSDPRNRSSLETAKQFNNWIY